MGVTKSLHNGNLRNNPQTKGEVLRKIRSGPNLPEHCLTSLAAVSYFHFKFHSDPNLLLIYGDIGSGGCRLRRLGLSGSWGIYTILREAYRMRRWHFWG